MSIKINIDSAFAQFSDTWSPRIIADLDNYHIKIVRLSGDFPWHVHMDADEMFYVLEGILRIDFREHFEDISAGEMIVIPKGVEHRPVADRGEVKVLVIEQASVVNTGDGPANEYTKAAERLS